MTRLIALLLLATASCSAPDPHFRHVPATRVIVEDSVFDVRVRGNLAEALRVNPEYAPRFGPIRGRAAFAMEKASGCRVLEVLGDQAQATGVLSCNGRPPNWIRSAVPLSYSCLEVSQWVSEGPGGPYSEFDCDPY